MKRLFFTVAAIFAIATTSSAEPGWQSLTVPGDENIRDQYHFSDAVRAGDFIYVSGVPGGRRTGETSDEPGYDRAMQRIAAALRTAGADWSDVISMTTYHTNISERFETFSHVKDRYIRAPYPAWTAIGVDHLLSDTATIEISVVAYAPRH